MKTFINLETIKDKIDEESYNIIKEESIRNNRDFISMLSTIIGLFFTSISIMVIFKSEAINLMLSMALFIGHFFLLDKNYKVAITVGYISGLMSIMSILAINDFHYLPTLILSFVYFYIWKSKLFLWMTGFIFIAVLSEFFDLTLLNYLFLIALYGLFYFINQANNSFKSDIDNIIFVSFNLISMMTLFHLESLFVTVIWLCLLSLIIFKKQYNLNRQDVFAIILFIMSNWIVYFELNETFGLIIGIVLIIFGNIKLKKT